MNAQLIINALNANNDFQSIALAVGMEIDDLKSLLTTAINGLPLTAFPEEKPAEIIEEKRPAIISDDDSGYDSDESSEDVYERILRESGIQFSDEQLEFIRLAVKERKSLSLLAPAGHGKSKIVQTCVELMQQLFEPYPQSWFAKRYGRFSNTDELARCPTFGLTASTGKAASLIKGRTIYSYLGIGIGKGPVSDWYKRVSTAKYLQTTFNYLRAVQVIIIDEISMISAELLDKISEYLQKIRKCDDPFGGIQMIFIGDVAQLSPVVGSFMFKSKEYQAANVQAHHLTKCFRQSDPVFLKLLNEIRRGECSDESFAILKAQTSIDEEYSNGLQPTQILSTNAEVDRINEQELAKICMASGMTPTAFPIIMTTRDSKKAEALRKSEMIPESVKLVVGAQIVITHNINRTVVNGSQGVVKSIRPNELTATLLDIGDVVIAYAAFKDPECHNIFTAKTIFEYLPVRLGWAMSIHKSQGSTMQLLQVDLKNVFCHGQGYVALSRVKSLQGLIVKGLSRKAFICNNEVKKYYLSQ